MSDYFWLVSLGRIVEYNGKPYNIDKKLNLPLANYAFPTQEAAEKFAKNTRDNFPKQSINISKRLKDEDD